MSPRSSVQASSASISSGAWCLWASA